MGDILGSIRHPGGDVKRVAISVWVVSEALALPEITEGVDVDSPGKPWGPPASGSHGDRWEDPVGEMEEEQLGSGPKALPS